VGRILSSTGGRDSVMDWWEGKCGGLAGGWCGGLVGGIVWWIGGRNSVVDWWEG
jgi:hypothetical protein